VAHQIQTTLSGIQYNLDWPNLPNVEKVDLGCLPMLETMMDNGIWVNQGHLETVRQMAVEQEEGNIAKLEGLVGRRINPESSQQTASLLYDELGFHKLLPKLPPKTDSGKQFTTDDGTLSAMRCQFLEIGLPDCYDVVECVVQARQANTIRTMFCEPLIEISKRSRDGRIRPRFKYTMAKTGRLACESPNLQNISVRSELGKGVRRAFAANGEYWRGKRESTTLVSCDYSQIEMRMAAHMSGDPNIAAVFWGGLDIHKMTAAAIFRVEPGEVTKLQRLVCKTLGFAILYGVTAEGLQEQIFAAGGPFWTLAQCEELIKGWFAHYRGIWEWVMLQQSRTRQYGCNWDFVGRPKLVPEAHSTIERVRDRGFRECGNFPLQAGAQAIIKIAMGELWPVIDGYRRYGVCEPLLQVHDELIFEVGEEMAGDFAEECRAAMAGVVNLDVPVDTSCDVGVKWGDLK